MRARRILAGGGTSLGYALVFVLAALGGVVVHVNLPGPRRTLLADVNAAIDPLFEGKLRIEGLGHVDPGGITGARARIVGMDGKQIVFAEGIDARIDTAALVLSLLRGRPIRLAISGVRIDYADVNLDQAPDGRAGFAAAFAEKTPSAPGSAPSPGVTLSVTDVAVAHGWVHGTPARGGPYLDLDADSVAASVDVRAPHPLDVTVTVKSADVTARGIPEHGGSYGRVTGAIHLPTGGPLPLGGHVTFAGEMGGVPLDADLALEEERIDLRLDVPHATPDVVRVLIPGAPVAAPVAAHVEAHGPMSGFDVTAHLEAGPGVADASARVVLASMDDRDAASIAVSGRATSKGIDLRAFVAQAPASDLGGVATFDLRADAKGARGTFAVDTTEGSLAGQSVPKVRLHGDFAPEGAGTRLHAQGPVDEPGLPTDVAIDLRPTPRGARLDFDIASAAPDLRRVSRVGAVSTGRATARAVGSIDLATETLDAKVSAHGEGLAPSGSATIDRADVQGTVHGPLRAPRVDLAIEGQGLTLGGFRFAHATATVRGDPRAPAVQTKLDPGEGTAPSVEATATLDTRGGAVTVRGIDLAVEKRRVRLDAHVDRVTAARGVVEVSGARVGGLGGDLDGSARIERGRLDLEVHGQKIEIARVAALVGTRLPAKGNVNVEASLHTSGAETSGTVRLDVEDAFVEKFGTGAAHVDLRVDAGKVTGRVDAHLEHMASVTLHAEDFALAGNALSPNAWRDGVGILRFAGTIDLARTPALFPAEDEMLGERRGVVAFEGSVGREALAAPVQAGLSLRTTGLVLAGKAKAIAGVGEETVAEAPPWRVTDIDAGADVRVDFGTGATELAARLFDARGALVALDSKAALPWEKLAAHPSDAPQVLEGAEISLRVVTPERKLADLPAWLGTKGLEGHAAAELVGIGTSRAPNLAVNLDVVGLHGAHAPNRAPVDGRIAARYDGNTLAAAFAGGSRGKRLLEGNAELLVGASDLVDRGLDAAWEASMRGSLTGFGLDTLPQVASRRVRGELEGSFALEHLHKDATAKVDLAFTGLRVAQGRYPSATVKAEAKAGVVTLAAHLEQTDGYADLHAKSGILWGSAVVPSLDPAQPITLGLAAQGFRASAAQPFVSGAVEGLDGRVDANVKASFVPARSGRPASAEAEGALTLTGGSLQIPTWGEELRDVQGRVDIRPDGTVRLSSGAARPTTGLVLTEGEAKFDGVTFKQATATVRVPDGQGVPIGSEGVALGEAYGDVNLAAHDDGRGYTIDVDLPRWHTQLTQTDKHTVQSLEARTDVHIGVRRGTELVVVPLSAKDVHPEVPQEGTPITVNLKLGQDVQVTRGAGLKIDVAGRTTLKLTDKARMTGQLQLKNGTLDVQGKLFTIDQGTVTFVEDPANPDVVVTAEWTAPDGTRVFADFVGPLKTGRVALRSEPARPQNEILALILFGTADSQAQTNAQSSSVQAANAGGGVAAAGLNKAIDNLTGLDNAAVRVDTSSNNNPRPQLDVQIAKDISVGVATVLGLPPPDQPDQVFGIFEWRFKPSWSLETMFGNLGSTLVDVVWRHRY